MRDLLCHREAAQRLRRSRYGLLRSLCSLAMTLSGAIGLGLFLSLAPELAFAGDGSNAIDPAIFRLSIFVITIFVGYYVVWSVTPALHTPLMSVTNAISSVIVVGALLAVTANTMTANDPAAALISRVLGFFALDMVSVNIFGGFLVTQRMLAMYKKKEK